MKKFILAAAIVFTTGILSTFTTSKSVKISTIKISAVVFGLRNDLATAD